MNLRAAAQQALEALEVATTPLAKDRQVVLSAREALRTALAEPEQEPPPKMRLLPCCGYHDGRAVFWNRFNGVVQCHSCGQQYAPHPPQRKPLTDEEIELLAVKHAPPIDPAFAQHDDFIEFARAIERAHGIGGNA